MAVMLIMLVGVLIGFRWFPQKWGKVNGWVQVAAVNLLIFTMGVKLGSRENFLQELSQLGLKSLLFAGMSILFSIIPVYFLTEKWIKPSRKKAEFPEEQKKE